MTPDQLATRINEILAGQPLRRSATVVRSGIDLEARTVELAFSSETDCVERWFGIEVLGHAQGEVNLARLTNGAPVLWDHNKRDQRGVVVSARIDADGIGRAVVRFSRSPAGEQLFQDIADGIVAKVSVGYSVEGLQLVEERGDVPVYRITAWTPFEISMVSIPADDTVGVGRGGEFRAADFPAPQSPGTNHPNTDGNRPPMNELQTLIAAARNSMAGVIHYNQAGDVRHVTPRAAARVSRISLRAMELPVLAADAIRGAHFPAGTQAGKKTTLSDAVLASSRARAAGAHIIMVPPADGGSMIGTLPANEAGGPQEKILVFRRQDVRFDHIAPAHFVAVPDGDEIGESALPVSRSKVDRDNIAAYGFRVAFTRAEQKSFQDGELADSALASIIMGLGRLTDRVLLDAIMETSPQPFSIADAAALGLAWSDIRALVGTDAAGALPAQDGTLRAIASPSDTTGVLAELTPEASATVVGAWSKAAIAVGEEITLIAERTDSHGGLAITCWCNMQALLPTPGAFWTLEG